MQRQPRTSVSPNRRSWVWFTRKVCRVVASQANRSILKAAIQHWLATASPTWETRNAAILELAGKYKEDPDLEQIFEEPDRRRGRPITEGGLSENLGD